MDMYLSLQVEQKLVMTNELDYYYYYWDYVVNIKSYVMEQLKQAAHRAEVEAYLTAKQAYDAQVQAGKKAKKKGAAALVEPVPPKQPMLAISDLIIKIKTQLLRGYLRTVLAATGMNASSVVKRQNIYTTWELKYGQRFKAFESCVNTGYVPFHKYLSGIAEYGGTSNIKLLLENASICYGNIKLYNDAKKMLLAPGTLSPWAQVARSLEEAQFANILKISITNVLQLKPILSSLAAAPAVVADDNVKVSTPVLSSSELIVDYKLSPCFPVMQLVMK